MAPAAAAEAIRAAPPIDAAVWKEREAVTRHDVAAFIDVLGDSMAAGGEWVHFGVTSSDILDTANGVLMRDAADVLLGRIVELPDDVAPEVGRVDILTGTAPAASVTDAVLAALGIEHGLDIVSADSDFARFPELTWINPVAG